MPYLRLVADRRGVEHTYLLHTKAPGEASKILYWYRTAPGLRLGRPALDDAAMRALEEQYPDIDFDWQYILDVGAMTPVEVEAPLPPRRRKPAPPRAHETDETVGAEAVPAATTAETPADTPAPRVFRAEPSEMVPDLLGELLGRGIAASLRAQHAELDAFIEAAVADPAVKASWRERLAALDPDGWESPEAVLAGMADAERGAAELRAAVERASTGA